MMVRASVAWLIYCDDAGRAVSCDALHHSPNVSFRGHYDPWSDMLDLWQDRLASERLPLVGGQDWPDHS